ncbi:S1 RNA-binding domain-containing protein [Candidatus Woesearchaeota archaeon]|nr:S1 RNA-binding domain-containing protein [Candidatus Woesearchaeota archaeon]
MLYKKQGRPEVGDVVICTVKRILYHSIFVSIDEYNNLEGMVHISEIAPGRIRNLRDYVIEGKRIVCKVLNINLQGNIDLSLRRVPLTLGISKINDYKQEEKAEKLLEQVGKEVKLDLKKIYDEIGYKAIEKYGGLYPFLQAIVDKGKNIIDELKPNTKLGDLIFKTVKDKIKPIEVSVSGIINLRSFNGNGIEDVKNILLKSKEFNVKVSYLGAPKYKLEIISKDYKTAENSLKGFIDSVTSMAKNLNCEFNFVKND